jgi:hypothetical protein
MYCKSQKSDHEGLNEREQRARKIRGIVKIDADNKRNYYRTPFILCFDRMYMIP